MSDTSTPQQRTWFTLSIQGGTPNMAQAAAVENCTLPMPYDVCLLLDMPINSTFAAGAAKLQARAAGQLSVY